MKISIKLSIISILLTVIAWMSAGLFFIAPAVIYLCWLIWIVSFLLARVGMRKIESNTRFLSKLLIESAPALAVIICLFVTYVSYDISVMKYVRCMSNIEGFGRGIKEYCDEHNGEFPKASQWCDILLSDPNKPYYISKDNFRCTDFENEETDLSSYAMNKNLDGKTWNEINPNTVIVFECIPGKNPNGGPELIRYNKHSFPFGLKKVNVILKGSDGPKFKAISKWQIGVLSWEP